MKPLTFAEIEQIIIEIIAEEVNRPASDFTKDVNLIYSLFIDSLSMLEICMVIEDRFDVIIKEDERKGLETVTLIAACIDKKLREKSVSND